MKAWRKGSDDWFLEFTAPFCKSAGLSVGNLISLVMKVADTSLPEELESLLAGKKSLSQSWSKLTDRQRREAAEHVRAAKSLVTRQRRAAIVIGKLGGT
jgi:uncharacterized protein YdeI (YjbR/CyaY-like superfamily)